MRFRAFVALLTFAAVGRVGAEPLEIVGPIREIAQVDVPTFGLVGHVGLDGSGGGVVAYVRESRVLARRLYPSGEPLGEEIVVALDPQHIPRDPRVHVQFNGAFTIAWVRHGLDSSTAETSLLGRSYGSNGEPLGEFFEIAGSADSPREVELAGDASGLLAAWAGYRPAEGGFIATRRFSYEGATRGVVHSIAFREPGGLIGHPDLARTDDGGFVAVWQADTIDGSERRYLAHALRLDEAGAPVGERIDVGEVYGFENPPSVAAGGGEWAVVMGRATGVFLRRFANDGSPLGAELALDAGGGRGPSITADDFGRYLAVWSAQVLNRFELQARVVVDGLLLGDVLGVVRGAETAGRPPHVSGTGDGDFQLVGLADFGRLLGVRLEKAGGAMAWTVARARVTEGSPAASVAVSRGGFGGAVSVSYCTENGSAEAGRDFGAVQGTLSWADGEIAIKTVTVPLLDDGVQEPREGFRLVLHSPTGGGMLGEPSVVEVTLLDDDGQPGRIGEQNEVTDGADYMPDVAIGEGGDALLVWWTWVEGSGPMVRGRIYDPSGAPRGPAFDIGAGDAPAVVGVQGGWLVAWQAGNELTVRRLDGTGALLGGEISIASTFEAWSRAIDLASDGENVVAVWDLEPQLGVAARRLAASGTPVGSTLSVGHGRGRSGRGSPSVAMHPGGAFAVVWEEDVGEFGVEVVVRTFDATGEARGVARPLSVEDDDSETRPDVAAIADGGYFAVWTGGGYHLSDGIEGRFVDASGVATADQLRIHEFEPGLQIEPHVDAGPPGEIVVVWSSGRDPGIDTDQETQDGSGFGVYGRRLDGSGAKVGAEFPLHSQVEGSQRFPTIAVGADGSFVAAWTETRYEGSVESSHGVSLQRFGGSSAPYLTSSSLPDFRFQVELLSGQGMVYGRKEAVCVPETLCVSGALGGRSELLLRIVGPKPNGYLWPTVLKFSTSTARIHVEQLSTGVRRSYQLSGARPGHDLLPGLFDRLGFLPATHNGSADSKARPALHSRTVPSGPWLSSPHVPGFRFKVAIRGASGRAERGCMGETLCVSGAVPGRSEVFIRMVGPKPNGRLWPTLVRASTSAIDVWVEQISSGIVRSYHLPAALPGSSALDGLFDREGFQTDG
jgi:hypothetical protein